MATVQEAGRGRKQCPSCSVYVGVRTHACECGHVFGAKPREQDGSQQEGETEPREHTEVLVYTPAGPCPAKLTKTDRKSVEEWAGAVSYEYAQKERFHLSIHALRYWARQQVSPAQFRIVSQHLEEICG